MSFNENKSKILACVTVGAIVVLMGAGIYSLYRFNGDSLDLRDREVRLIVSGSMDGEPTEYTISTIPIDSLIIIQRLDQSELDTIAVGDVIAYDRNGAMIVHRVIDVRDDGSFITKGDANSSVDPIVYPEKVIGKVLGVSEISGKIVTLAKDKLVWVAAFAACVVITIYCIREIRRVYSEKEDDYDDDAVR